MGNMKSKHSEFYDNVEAHSYAPSKRARLDTIHVRDFNNARKRELIEKYTPSRAKVLDLAAGKGGDLHKWNAANAAYVIMLDQSNNSLKEAEKRYHTIRDASFDLSMLCGDFCDDASYKPLQDEFFDVVSCQFALHYAFSQMYDYKYARTLLNQVGRVLKPRGHFLCTVPNPARVRAFPPHNAYCTIRRLKEKPFDRYKFHLRGAVEDSVEFYVEFDILTRLAKEAGLVLRAHHNFSDTKDNRLDDDSRSVVDLYESYVFIKE